MIQFIFLNDRKEFRHIFCVSHKNLRSTYRQKVDMMRRTAFCFRIGPGHARNTSCGPEPILTGPETISPRSECKFQNMLWNDLYRSSMFLLLVTTDCPIEIPRRIPPSGFYWDEGQFSQTGVISAVDSAIIKWYRNRLSPLHSMALPCRQCQASPSSVGMG